MGCRSRRPVSPRSGPPFGRAQPLVPALTRRGDADGYADFLLGASRPWSPSGTGETVEFDVERASGVPKTRRAHGAKRHGRQPAQPSVTPRRASAGTRE